MSKKWIQWSQIPQSIESIGTYCILMLWSPVPINNLIYMYTYTVYNAVVLQQFLSFGV